MSKPMTPTHGLTRDEVSQGGNMKIEEYAVETCPQSEEFTDEAKALVEKLGASEQHRFYDRAQPAAYRKMTPLEYAVYKVVLPERQEIKDFKACPIPLRVLQIGAHAQECLSGTLVVWHAGEGKDDPLLTLRDGHSYNGTYYLLARWATELEEFSVLLEQAVKKLTAKTRTELAAGKMQLDSWIATLEDQVRTRLMEGKTDTPSVHWF